MGRHRTIIGRRTLLAAPLALAVGLAAVGAPQTAQAATKILSATVFLSSTVWSELVADAKGYFAKRGLEVEIIPTRSSSKVVQQAAAGSVQIASSGIPDSLRAIDQGAPMKIFMSQIGTPPYTIYAKPEIKSIKALKGKTVMIGGPKDVTRYYTETLFAKHGLERGAYDYLYAGSTANRFAALTAGGVDATILLPPLSFRADAEGYANLGNIQTVLSDFPFTIYAYNADWAKENRKVLVDFTAAVLEANEWLYDPANREEAADILVSAAKFKKEDALKTYDALIKDMQAVSRSGVVSEDAYTKMMNVLIGWGDMKAPVPPMSKFYDDSVLAAAKAEMKN